MNGIVNVIKPAGMSSSDVVSRMRRILHEKHVGHLGTLDPAAAGVLPILVGKAARLFDYLSVHSKVYIAEFCLGAETDTLDAEGTVTEEVPWDGDLARLREILTHYVGEIDQMPPVYSAVKLQGRKAYDLARKGQEVEIPTRHVHIHSLDLLRAEGNRVWIRLECETGTYVRSLCRDVAREAGTRGYLTFLLRTQSGMYTLDNALTLPEASILALEGKLPVQTMEEAVSFLPKVVLPAGKEVDLINGWKPRLNEMPAEGTNRMYCGERFIGLGHGRLNEKGRPEFKMDLYLLPEEEQEALVCRS